MDKEAEGLIFDAPEPVLPKSSRWSAVGKVCSSRPFNKTALERTMQRAWGLHREAQFRDMGSNIFVVHFGSEGDWKHAMSNGPWQYDFSVLILKEYEGGTRPSEMVFDKVDIWVRVSDLPPDKRTEDFGKALGNWLGEVVKVDVDKDGIARGKDLRVRAKIPVYEPLVRGFYLKTSKQDTLGTWFDFYYEKVPHFCFDCGRLVHVVGGVCDPPLDSSSQWGEWLRASPGRNKSVKEGSTGGAASSTQSFSSAQSGEGSHMRHEQPRVRDMPTKRNLNSEFSRSGGTRTGGRYQQERGEVMSPSKENRRNEIPRETDLRDSLEQMRETDLRNKLYEQQQQKQRDAARDLDWDRKGKDKAGSSQRGNHAQEDKWTEPYGGPGLHGVRWRRRGTYVRKYRENYEQQRTHHSQLSKEAESRKRRPKQLWVAKGDPERQIVHDAFIRDTRLKTSTVFDSISENKGEAADPATQGRREQ